jgi:hypothetical protein
MELTKTIFFFIGSLGGILAFVHTIIESAFIKNRDKWKGVQEKLTEQDLIDLQYMVFMSRRIDSKLLARVHSFVRDVESDAEYLRFGLPFRNLFEKHKRKLSKSYRRLCEYVQVPYWERRRFIEEDTEYDYWDFDKSFFYKEVPKGERAYVDHLNEASDTVDEVRYHYRALSILANLHSFEAPLAYWIVKKRSLLPER